MIKKLKLAIGSCALLVLASCGGGGDVAGDTDEFGVSPSEWKLTVPAGYSCGASKGAYAVFTIIGGQPPFRIVSAFPESLEVDKTEATGKDPKFKVTSKGGCGDSMTITVLDYHSQTTTVGVTIEVEKATATEPTQ